MLPLLAPGTLINMKKRILLSNFHLKHRQGSELYTLELASALIETGHVVAVFTFVTGAVSEQMKKLGITVLTQDKPSAIEAFKPDIIHIHHLPCLYFLGSLNLNAPMIHSMLGPSTPFELPPSRAVGINRFLAVSEEVKAASLTSINNAAPIEIFRNWFDNRKPLFQHIDMHKPITSIKKVAVVTNHLALDLVEYLNRLNQEDSSFTWQHFGLPGNSIDITAEILLPFDAVITIGRTVLLAAALGKPVLIHDVHGSDGWLTHHNIEKAEQFNFSGRAHGAKPSFEKWKNQFLLGYKEIDLEALSLKVRENFALSKRIEQLQSIYNSLEKVTIADVLERKNTYKNEARVFSSFADQVFHLSLHAENLNLHAQNLTLKIEHLTHAHQNHTISLENLSALLLIKLLLKKASRSIKKI